MPHDYRDDIVFEKRRYFTGCYTKAKSQRFQNSSGLNMSQQTLTEAAACSRLSVVEHERKKKRTSERKNEGRLALVLPRCSSRSSPPNQYEEQVTNRQSSYLFHLESNLFFS